MYQKILVPLDGSERAEVILPHVEEVALRFAASVLLIQVVEAPAILSNPYDMTPQTHLEGYQLQLDAVKDYLHTQQQRLQGKGISTEIKVVEGPTVAMIIETAVLESADLIAMASHGRSGLSRVFYGSVAAGVLHQIDRPLLLIRSQ